jgi:hypothetical protein
MHKACIFCMDIFNHIDFTLSHYINLNNLIFNYKPVEINWSYWYLGFTGCSKEFIASRGTFLLLTSVVEVNEV